MTQRTVVPFSTSVSDLERLVRAAQVSGDTETARTLLKTLSDHRLRERYARMAEETDSFRFFFEDDEK